MVVSASTSSVQGIEFTESLQNSSSGLMPISTISENTENSRSLATTSTTNLVNAVKSTSLATTLTTNSGNAENSTLLATTTSRAASLNPEDSDSTFLTATTTASSDSKSPSTTMSNSTATSLSRGATLPAIPPDTQTTESKSSSSTTSSFSQGNTLPTVPPGNQTTTASESQTANTTFTPSGLTPASTSSSSSIRHAISNHSSVVTEVVTRTGRSSSSTSTITDQPESTLSSAVPVTVVDPLGKSSLSFPAILTLYSTTSEPNGSFVTFTHVIANPTGFLDGGQGPSGFLDDGAKVAGVFMTVGIVLAALFVSAYLLAKRRSRRSRQRRRWIEGIRPPSTQDPFEDPPLSAMIQSGNNGNSLLFTQHREVFISHPYRYEPPAEDRDGKPPRLVGDSHHLRDDEIGLAVSKDLSDYSPSLYPPTLPPVEPEPQNLLETDTSPNKTPPRPPRSHLRETAKLITPPSSVSSHDRGLPEPLPLMLPTTNNTPGRSMQDDVLSRPTILNVSRA